MSLYKHCYTLGRREGATNLCKTAAVCAPAAPSAFTLNQRSMIRQRTSGIYLEFQPAHHYSTIPPSLLPHGQSIHHIYQTQRRQGSLHSYNSPYWKVTWQQHLLIPCRPWSEGLAFRTQNLRDPLCSSPPAQVTPPAKLTPLLPPSPIQACSQVPCIPSSE